ncbi:type IV pili methyl-accepting chemotaxis transducer N-terminal domain-containing protein [Nitratifractor sp.]|uniref:type IV pili methyl-accepting chemotaxis transducer N-terminal domain-containing protein n=1 Tax=Nitratifractor sp. TaxID=2268144 RepID=UPI0025CB968F|nr:type IV pili methyl-accepting chemotaxis transducer N-terminal domain-containing protein [Nitratifractor sp.]
MMTNSERRVEFSFRLFEGEVLKRMFIVVLIGTASLNALEIKNDLQAINLAGSERMMSMKMLKDYILVAMNDTYKNPKKDLQKTMERFEETQRALDAYVKDPEIAEQLKKVDQMWNNAKNMLESPPKKEEALKYLKTMNILKETANEATVLLTKKSKHGTSQAVNTAGRLRAISQTIAALYMLKTWAEDKTRSSMEKVMKNFRNSLDFLKRALKNDTQAKKVLKNMEKNYLFFSMMEDAEVFTPILVIKRTNRMLKKADDLTRYLVKKQTKGGE